MLSVVRCEEKYPLNVAEASQYANRFSKLLQPDAFSKNGSYMVRSLYFDTIYDKDFFDKVNEQNIRRKIRIRIYNPDDQFAKLEIKQKQNIYQKKRSLRITRADAMELIRGNTSVLLKYDNDFAAEVFVLMNEYCYRPKTIVQYDRRAFMAKENNIRLTFDSNIRATETDMNLFSKNLNMNLIYPADQVIFEVKYDRFLLGYIKDIISTIDRRNVSSSKYCLGRKHGYPLYF